MANPAAAIDEALAERARTGGPGRLSSRVLARGPGWIVSDVICASGPRDRPFEERHDSYAISMVAAGTFRYSAPAGSDLLTPGSLMLGNAGQCFECGHEHGAGDRCVCFQYDPAYFERIAGDAGARGSIAFRHARLPALRALSGLVAQVSAGITGGFVGPWEELSIRLAAAAVALANDVTASPGRPHPAAVRRVAAVVRALERRPPADLSLGAMARAAGLSPFHFLRTFEQVTGTPPHQFVLRTRLREAARRLMTEDGRVIDVALDCGYAGASRFSHAFRAEFGVSPRVFRRQPSQVPPSALKC